MLILQQINALLLAQTIFLLIQLQIHVFKHVQLVTTEILLDIALITVVLTIDVLIILPGIVKQNALMVHGDQTLFV